MPYRDRNKRYEAAPGLHAAAGGQKTPHFGFNTLGQTSQSMFFNNMPGPGTDPIFSIGVNGTSGVSIDTTPSVAPAHLDPLINPALHQSFSPSPIQQHWQSPQPAMTAARAVPHHRHQQPLPQRRPQQQQQQQQQQQALPSPAITPGSTTPRASRLGPVAAATVAAASPAPVAAPVASPAARCPAPAAVAVSAPATTTTAALSSPPLPVPAPPQTPGPPQTLTPAQSAATEAACRDMAATISAAFPYAAFAARHGMTETDVSDFLRVVVLAPLVRDPPARVPSGHEGEGRGVFWSRGGRRELDG